MSQRVKAPSAPSLRDLYRAGYRVRRSDGASAADADSSARAALRLVLGVSRLPTLDASVLDLDARYARVNDGPRAPTGYRAAPATDTLSLGGVGRSDRDEAQREATRTPLREALRRAILARCLRQLPAPEVAGRVIESATIGHTFSCATETYKDSAIRHGQWSATSARRAWVLPPALVAVLARGRPSTTPDVLRSCIDRVDGIETVLGSVVDAPAHASRAIPFGSYALPVGYEADAATGVGCAPATVRRAWWWRDGRGASTIVGTGVVARVGYAGEHTAHGPDVATACATLTRRVRALRSGREEGPPVDAGERMTRRVHALRRHHDVRVTLDDSVRAGNCRVGTEDFAQKHVDGAPETTIGVVLFAALSTGDRVPLALAACEAALKRHRKAMREASDGRASVTA